MMELGDSKQVDDVGGRSSAGVRASSLSCVALNPRLNTNASMKEINH
jgi:hypothetical protein